MEYRRLGQSGLRVSSLSFGSWVTFGTSVDKKLARELMAMAYDAGINFFDNAEVYENGTSERLMGEALTQLNWSRDSYCVSSKVFWGGDKPTQKGLSRKHIHDACHAALKRLHVEYLDLFFCHRPDKDTPMEETVRAMDVLIQQGKVLYWGTSEWSAQQITQAFAVARQYGLTPPTMEQPQYNMFVRERFEAEYRRLYSEYGLGTTIWSPLASGILTGKYNNGVPAGSRFSLENYKFLRDRFETNEGLRRIEIVKQLAPIAEQLGCSLAQLAIAWCLRNPSVSTVILGASSVKQLQENLKSLDVLPQLDSAVLKAIDTLLGNKPAPEPTF